MSGYGKTSTRGWARDSHRSLRLEISVFKTPNQTGRHDFFSMNVRDSLSWFIILLAELGHLRHKKIYAGSNRFTPEPPRYVLAPVAQIEIIAFDHPRLLQSGQQVYAAVLFGLS